MQENKQQTRQGNEKKQRANLWKWAFFGLLTLIVGFFIYLAVSIQPVVINGPNLEPVTVSNEAIELSTEMNKEDAEQVVNAYLNTTLGQEFSGYQIALTDQLEIHGPLTVFGFEVPFALYFEPFVQENGNIQLRGETVELANFSLPVSAVMSLLARQIDFPEFIAVNSEEQVIMLNLNELTKDYNFDLEMTKIDLEAGILELNLRMDESAMMNQLQME